MVLKDITPEYSIKNLFKIILKYPRSIWDSEPNQP